MANFKVNDALRIEEELRAIADKLGAGPADTPPKFKVQDTKKIWEQLNRIEKGAGGAVNFKRYSVLLSQSGTNAPVPVILENTLSGVPVWTRTGVGEYRLTLAGEFPANKFFIQGIINQGSLISLATQSPPNFLVFNSFSTFDINTPDDNELGQMPLEIRVYP